MATTLPSNPYCLKMEQVMERVHIQQLKINFKMEQLCSPLRQLQITGLTSL